MVGPKSVAPGFGDDVTQREARAIAGVRGFNDQGMSSSAHSWTSPLVGTELHVGPNTKTLLHYECDINLCALFEGRGESYAETVSRTLPLTSHCSLGGLSETSLT